MFQHQMAAEAAKMRPLWVSADPPTCSGRALALAEISFPAGEASGTSAQLAAPDADICPAL